MYKHILIPTDGSKLSESAVMVGVKLAKAVGAKVTGFYAPPPATPLEFKGLLPGYIDPEEHSKAIEKATRKYLEVIERAIVGLSLGEHRSERTRVGEVVVKFVLDEHVDLLRADEMRRSHHPASELVEAHSNLVQRSNVIRLAPLPSDHEDHR